jgi:hypothetical protein
MNLITNYEQTQLKKKKLKFGTTLHCLRTLDLKLSILNSKFSKRKETQPKPKSCSSLILRCSKCYNYPTWWKYGGILGIKHG